MNDEQPNVNHGSRAIAFANEILRTTVGSEVHGIAEGGSDDHDEMGIYIEPPRFVVGTSYWSYKHNAEMQGVPEGGSSGFPHYISRTKPEGERSGPGDVDLNMYSLRKFAQLAAKGNPTMLLPLFAPDDDVLIMSDAGDDLRALRKSFLSQSAIRRFLAYMDAQHDRMLGYGRQSNVPFRPELIEKHGWDTKYGSHALRLAYQGLEVALEGTLTLPLAPVVREQVLQVKRGEVPRDQVSDEITQIAKTIRYDILEAGKSPLPEQPDWDTINAFLLGAHAEAWGY